MKHIAILAVAGLALGGCSLGQQAIVDGAISGAETGIKAYHDQQADVLFKLQCGIPVGGMLRTRTVEEQKRIMLNCGGQWPDLTPEEIELIQNALEP